VTDFTATCHFNGDNWYLWLVRWAAISNDRQDSCTHILHNIYVCAVCIYTHCTHISRWLRVQRYESYCHTRKEWANANWRILGSPGTLSMVAQTGTHTHTHSHTYGTSVKCYGVGGLTITLLNRKCCSNKPHCLVYSCSCNTEMISKAVNSYTTLYYVTVWSVKDRQLLSLVVYWMDSGVCAC